MIFIISDEAEGQVSLQTCLLHQLLWFEFCFRAEFDVIEFADDITLIPSHTHCVGHRIRHKISDRTVQAFGSE